MTVDVLARAIAERDYHAHHLARINQFIEQYRAYEARSITLDGGSEGSAPAAVQGDDSQAKASIGKGGSTARMDSAPVSGEASRLSGGSGTAAIIPEAPHVVTAAPKPTRLDRVRAYLADHPDAMAREIGDAIGLNPKHVRSVAARAGLHLRAATRPAPTGATRADQVRAYAAAHPDATARQIGEALGISQMNVNMIAKKGDIAVQRVRVRHLAKGDDGALPSGGKSDGAEPAEAPHRPAGANYRLRDPATGLYLHQGIPEMCAAGRIKLVGLKQYPWQGNRKQLGRVRELLPEAMKLRIIPVARSVEVAA